MDKIITNKVNIIGTIASEFKKSHSVMNEDFYIFQIHTKRLSETLDTIPVIISERLIDINQKWIGKQIDLSGNFRSYNKYELEKSRVILYVMAKNLKETNFLDNNKIFLDGYICKQPIYRKTPLGREITDFILAVNYSHRKSSYIPCVAWGKNARLVSGFSVGTRLQINGRIQSREYSKRMERGGVQIRVAYEVSVLKIPLILENGMNDKMIPQF